MGVKLSEGRLEPTVRCTTFLALNLAVSQVADVALLQLGSNGGRVR